MSENMNTLTEKIGEVSRATNTMASAAINAIDSTEQTRMRQEHIAALSERLRRGDFKNPETGGIDEANVGQLQHELDTIAQRCPSIESMKTHDGDFRNAARIASAEMGELYEVVEKMRDLDAATTTTTEI